MSSCSRARCFSSYGAISRTGQRAIWTSWGDGDNSIPRFEHIFREVCKLAVEEDGLVFSAESVRGDTIKEDQEYEGLRLNLDCRLENARIPIQIDIGFGDVVTPAATDVTYPVLLDFPAPVLPAYSRESVVAEKFQAMVMLGIANSRMKDFYDLWVLARQFEFQGPLLCQAIRATFERRRDGGSCRGAGGLIVRVCSGSREADAVAGVHRQGQAGYRGSGTG